MDVAIEFSAQFEREQLHRKFIRTVRAVFYTVLCCVFGLAFFSDGGTDARFLPFFFLASFVALSCELLATVKRLDHGNLISTGFLIFLPWLALQLIDTLWLSPASGNAVVAFGMNLVAVVFFFIAQQRSRSNGGQNRLLAATIILLVAGLVAGIADQIRISEDFSGTLTMKIFAGYLSDPAAAGGAAILVFFGSLVFAGRRGYDYRKRLLALYTGLLALGLILLTRNTAVWLATLAGCIVFASLRVHKKTVRAAIVVFLACGIAVAPIFSEMPFGVPAEIASVQKAETAKQESAPSRLDLEKIALKIFSEHAVLGAGNGSFLSEFRKYAPPKWQVSPTTGNNLYSFVLAENGILGLLLLLVPAGFIFVRGVCFCLALPHRLGSKSSRTGEDEKFHNSSTRSLLSGLLGGIAASAVLVGFEFSPSLLPVILGVSIFGGIVMHESTAGKFSKIYTWTGGRHKIAFVGAVLLPAGIFVLFVPASYSAAQCEIGKRALTPFLLNFYGNTKLATDRFDPAGIETPLLKAVSAQPKNARAWIELARFYALFSYVAPESISELAGAMNRAAERAVDAAPELSEAYFYKAVSEIVLGRKDVARESLKRAESLAPNDLPLLFQITEAYRMLSSQKTPPTDLLTRLSQIAPSSPRVRQMNSIIDLSEQSRDAGKNKSDDADASVQSLFEI